MPHFTVGPVPETDTEVKSECQSLCVRPCLALHGYCAQYTVYCILNCTLYIVHNVYCIHGRPYLLHTIYTQYSIVLTLYCLLYIILCIVLCTVPCKLCAVYCILHTIVYTVSTIQFTAQCQLYLFWLWLPPPLWLWRGTAMCAQLLY